MIFLDLTKVYDALYRSRYLEILEGYGVSPSARRLLTTYWRRLTMVARAGGYYRNAFKGERGVTQGDPLSPTVFNVVVDAARPLSPNTTPSIVSGQVSARGPPPSRPSCSISLRP